VRSWSTVLEEKPSGWLRTSPSPGMVMFPPKDAQPPRVAAIVTARMVRMVRDVIAVWRLLRVRWLRRRFAVEAEAAGDASGIVQGLGRVVR